jgi:proteasome lid subunit RPN8/RPN11
LHLRDLGPTEVGGFGVSAQGDLLLVEDVRLVRQACSAVTVKFDDVAVADYFDSQVDQGRTPEQFARIWVHSHPASCPLPSSADEETFARCFGAADWAVLFIVARGGEVYARIRFGSGPGGQLELPVEVDFQQPFAAADHKLWEQEYWEAVTTPTPPRNRTALNDLLQANPFSGVDPFHERLLLEEPPYHPFHEVLDGRFD